MHKVFNYFRELFHHILMLIGMFLEMEAVVNADQVDCP